MTIKLVYDSDYFNKQITYNSYNEFSINKQSKGKIIIDIIYLLFLRKCYISV